MKVIKHLYLAFIFTMVLFVANSFAQASDSTQVQNNSQQDDIVEAGEAIIKIEVEKPQVQLFSQRIKPEFDEVNLEKSFIREIIDEGQTLKIQSTSDKKNDIIDIKKLLNRNR